VRSGAVAATTGAARSLLRLTPAGDAARMWLPTAIAALIVTFVFFVVGGTFRSVHWLVGIDVLYGLILVLTWGAMWLSTPADVRRWALAQEPPPAALGGEDSWRSSRTGGSSAEARG
jgi:hypothetical protein